MEKLNYMKSVLFKYNFPFVESKSDEDILQIFHSSNRKQLILWILKNISFAYEYLDQEPNQEELLANHITELGFCSQKENVQFIQGTLPIEKQIEIMHRSLKYLDNINQKSLEDNYDSANLNDLLDKDLNIFPEFGPIQVISESDLTRRVQELKEKVKELKEYKAKVTSKTDFNFKELSNEILINLNKLKQKLPDLKSLHDKLKCEPLQTEQFKTDQTCIDYIIKGNENCKKISNFMENLKVMQNFKVKDAHSKGPEELLSLMRTLQQTVYEMHRLKLF